MSEAPAKPATPAAPEGPQKTCAEIVNEWPHLKIACYLQPPMFIISLLAFIGYIGNRGTLSIIAGLLELIGWICIILAIPAIVSEMKGVDEKDCLAGAMSSDTKKKVDETWFKLHGGKPLKFAFICYIVATLCVLLAWMGQASCAWQFGNTCLLRVGFHFGSVMNLFLTPLTMTATFMLFKLQPAGPAATSTSAPAPKTDLSASASASSASMEV